MVGARLFTTEKNYPIWLYDRGFDTVYSTFTWRRRRTATAELIGRPQSHARRRRGLSVGVQRCVVCCRGTPEGRGGRPSTARRRYKQPRVAMLGLWSEGVVLQGGVAGLRLPHGGVTRRLHLQRQCDSTSINYDSTAIRPRYDRSTTYVTIVGLPAVGCCTAA